MQSHPLIFCITFCISIGLIFFPLNPQYTFRSVPHTVVFAEGVKDAKKEQTVKKSPDFIEIYMNDVPETIMDTLACEGAMIKQAFLSYGADGSRIYKVIILTSSLEETTRYFSEDGKVIR